MTEPRDAGSTSGLKVVSNHYPRDHDFSPATPARQSRKQPERALQVALIEHLSWRAPAGTWWTHFPAGGRRSRVTGAILKGMGTKPGCPDLFVVSHGKLYGLELKA